MWAQAWGFNDKHLLLTVPEAGSPRPRHQEMWHLVRAHFLVQSSHFWLCPQPVAGVSLRRTLIPCMSSTS